MTQVGEVRQETPPPALAALLRCVFCGMEVAVGPPGMVCRNGHVMAFRNGYLDASTPTSDPAEAKTLRSFGYEWTTFDTIEPEDEEFWRRYVADLDLTELRDRIGVDVGCGKARYTRFTARHLAAMIALDGSEAVASAARNLRDMPGTMVVKATIDAMPLAEAGFGYVSCLGVLHHLRDPRAGFDRIARLLAPGGVLLLYLYSRPESFGLRSGALAAARIARRATVRMPHRALRALCAPLAALLYLCFVIPGRWGQRLGIGALDALPLAFYRGKPPRSLWLDTFDRLSAPIENRYVWSELAPWFSTAGLVVASVREESGYFVVARRPPA